MLPERPLREPLIGQDGQLSRRWKDYFDALDTGQETSDTFEIEQRLVGESSSAAILAHDLRRKTRKDPPDYPVQDRRVSRLQAQLRELRFLEQ